MTRLYDKTGRAIEPGDVLKIFHFVGARRRRHYMYKQAVEYMPNGRLKISHLNRLRDEPWEIGVNYCTVHVDDRMMPDYEIVS